MLKHIGLKRDEMPPTEQNEMVYINSPEIPGETSFSVDGLKNGVKNFDLS